MTELGPGRHKEQRSHLGKNEREARKQIILPNTLNEKNTRNQQRKTRNK